MGSPAGTGASRNKGKHWQLGNRHPALGSLKETSRLKRSLVWGGNTHGWVAAEGVATTASPHKARARQGKGSFVFRRGGGEEHVAASPCQAGAAMATPAHSCPRARRGGGAGQGQGQGRGARCAGLSPARRSPRAAAAADAEESPALPPAGGGRCPEMTRGGRGGRRTEGAGPGERGGAGEPSGAAGQRAASPPSPAPRARTRRDSAPAGARLLAPPPLPPGAGTHAQPPSGARTSRAGLHRSPRSECVRARLVAGRGTVLRYPLLAGTSRGTIRLLGCYRYTYTQVSLALCCTRVPGKQRITRIGIKETHLNT